MDRRKALTLVHIARKDLALEEDSYRDLLERVTGWRSAKECTDHQLQDVLDEFKRLGWTAVSKPRRAGNLPLHDSPLAGKIRALWLSLYHLGEIVDPSEAALNAFILRTVNIEALSWLTPRDADRVIDALNGWCRRVGFVQPDVLALREVNKGRTQASLPEASAGLGAKIALIERQWNLLIELGATKYNMASGLYTFINNHYHVSAAAWLDPVNADRCVERLGAWIRKAKAKRVSQETISSQDGSAP